MMSIRFHSKENLHYKYKEEEEQMGGGGGGGRGRKDDTRQTNGYKNISYKHHWHCTHAQIILHVQVFKNKNWYLQKNKTFQ